MERRTFGTPDFILARAARQRREGSSQRRVLELASGRVFSDVSRLDAIQGSGEARTELYQDVLQGSTGADDAVMRQEFGQSSELGSEAGQNGGGV